MYFHICNEYNVRNYKLMGDKTLLIRALEPSYKECIPYEIDNISSYSDVLELYIEDTVRWDHIDREDAFNIEKAKMLNEFILNNDFDEVVVHCALGVSRSPALMICISKILGNEELEKVIKSNYHLYNEYIVRLFEEFPYVRKSIDNTQVCGNVLDVIDNDEILVLENGMYVLKLR